MENERNAQAAAQPAEEKKPVEEKKPGYPMHKRKYTPLYTIIVFLYGLLVKLLFFIVHRGRPPILIFLKISLWRYILGSAKAKKALIYPSDEKVNRRPCRGDRIIVLSTTVFTNFPHFMEHNQTASMRVKTAILLTWTIGAYCARALTPTFSWGEPTMAVFRPRSPQTSAV